jgi:hypothetical protein
MKRGVAKGALVSMVSFVGIVITLAILLTQDLRPDASAILSVVCIVLLIMIIVGLLLVLVCSEDRLQVSGSPFEWMLAALISPGDAIFLYFFANTERDSGRDDYIDIEDEKRMSRL